MGRDSGFSAVSDLLVLVAGWALRRLLVAAGLGLRVPSARIVGGRRGEVPREWGSLSLGEVSQEIGPAVDQLKRSQTCFGVWCGANASERQRKEVDPRQACLRTAAVLVRCVLMMPFTRSTLPDDWGR